MDKNTEKCSFKECGFHYTLALISGKYKMSILYILFRYELVRYNELKRLLEGISFKTLTNALRELQNDKLILRKEYPQIPRLRSNTSFLKRVKHSSLCLKRCVNGAKRIKRAFKPFYSHKAYALKHWLSK